MNKEWPPGKVAAILGISVGQVYQDKHRVLETVKEKFTRLQREKQN